MIKLSQGNFDSMQEKIDILGCIEAGYSVELTHEQEAEILERLCTTTKEWHVYQLTPYGQRWLKSALNRFQTC